MKTAANVLYFLAYRNAYKSFLQLEEADEPQPSSLYNSVNALRKDRIVFEERDNTNDIDDKNLPVYDMILIAGSGYQLNQLEKRINFARQHLSANGVILFDFANPQTRQDDKRCGSAWQLVARLRCAKSGFVCVLADVGQGCAVYRPALSSIAFAAKHLTQFDDFDYLVANRNLLLNLMTTDTFLTLLRYF